MPFSPEQARQTRLDQDKLWVALGSMEPDFDHGDKDVYTLAAEAIEESGVLRAQKRDLEYRLEAQKEINKGVVEIVLVERANAIRDLCTAKRTLEMVRRISRLCSTFRFYPCKTIDKLVTAFFNGDVND